MHRIFISLPIPKEIRFQLDYEMAEIEKLLPVAARFAPLEEFAPNLAAPEIVFESIGYGPSVKDPRMVWALTNSATAAALGAMREAVSEALTKAGIRFSYDHRPVSHVTLARLNRSTLPTTSLSEIARPFTKKFTAEKIDLLESDSRDSGAEYAELGSWTLDEK